MPATGALASERREIEGKREGGRGKERDMGSGRERERERERHYVYCSHLK
jgi:hypothetical protein